MLLDMSCGQMLVQAGVSHIHVLKAPATTAWSICSRFLNLSLQAFVAVFATTTFAPVARLHTGADSLRQISFLPESQVILAATANGRLLKWDLAAGGSTRPQTRQMASCSAFGLDALWGYVAAAGADGQLALWPLDWTVRLLTLASC